MIPVSTSTHTGTAAPAPPRTSPVTGEPAGRGGHGLQAPPHLPGHRLEHGPGQVGRAVGRRTARRRRPRRRARHHGARAPSSQGAAITPRAPGGLSAASSASSPGGWPVSRPSQARKEPAADSPPSSSHPPRPPATAPARWAPDRPVAPTGTDTLAVVPQLTMGHDSPAPAPSTSHGRSPAPIDHRRAGRQAEWRRPRPPAGPLTWSEGTTGGSSATAAPASSSTTRPSRS